MGERVRIISNPGSDDARIKALFEQPNTYLIAREPVKWTPQDIAEHKVRAFIKEHAPQFLFCEFPRV